MLTGTARLQPSEASGASDAAAATSSSDRASSNAGANGSSSSSSGGNGPEGSGNAADPNGNAANDDADPSDTPEPLYLLHSAVQGDDGRLNYFTPVTSLTDERTLDYASSLELPGRARLYADAATGVFMIGDGESLTLRRYSLSEGGQLLPGERVSLQNQGVTSLGAQAMAFISPTKAYYKDSAQAQVIVINPQAMTVDAVLPLPAELIREGTVINVSDWAVRDGEAYFAVGWTTAVYDRALEGSVLVRIDTENDTLTTTTDSRCRELSMAANLGGTLYFFSGVINGFGHAVYPNDGGQPDCFLRVLPGEQSFDPGAMGTLSGALPAGSSPTAVTLTDAGVLWANVADLALATTAPGSTYGEWYEGGWSWWSMALDTNALGTIGVAERVEQAPGAFSSSVLAFDGAFLISHAEADYALTTLVDLASGTPTAGLSFPGFTLDIARLR